MKSKDVVAEVPGLYCVMVLRLLRRTPGVQWDCWPTGLLPRVDAVDRVIHAGAALSPGSVGDVARPWYWHACQADNLMVLHGTRYVDLYTPGHGRVESFVVAPDRIEHDGAVVCDGPSMLLWPVRVFHRVRSDAVHGSASVNFATHFEGFDLRTNFDIFDVDTATGASRVIREGWRDQPGTD